MSKEHKFRDRNKIYDGVNLHEKLTKEVEGMWGEYSSYHYPNYSNITFP